LYGFFQTHVECEWLVGELRAGLGEEKEGMSFPGWLPGVLVGMSGEGLEKLGGWVDLGDKWKERFLKMTRKRKVKGEPELEYRYWDKDTRERTSFKSTMEGLGGILPSV